MQINDVVHMQMGTNINLGLDADAYEGEGECEDEINYEDEDQGEGKYVDEDEGEDEHDRDDENEDEGEYEGEDGPALRRPWSEEKQLLGSPFEADFLVERCHASTPGLRNGWPVTPLDSHHSCIRARMRYLVGRVDCCV